MPRYFIVLLALAASLNATAQSRTKYYDGKQQPTRKDNAQSYAEYSWVDGQYEVVHYSMSGSQIRMKGHYTTMDADLKSGREGAFTYYHTNEKVSEEGMYKDNMRTGLWRAYFYSTGSLRSETTYKLDSLDGPFVSYDTQGRKAKEGSYVNGAKEGEWKQYIAGHKVTEEVYIAGRVAERKQYDSSGKLTSSSVYKNGKFSSGSRYDAAGNATPVTVEEKPAPPSVFKYVEHMPSAPYNIAEYLSENLVYPKKSMKKNEHGRVIVRFVINELGNIEDVVITKGVSEEIDAEALRVVSGMPKWEPGMQNGEPVKVYYNLPINFELK